MKLTRTSISAAAGAATLTLAGLTIALAPAALTAPADVDEAVRTALRQAYTANQ